MKYNTKQKEKLLEIIYSFKDEHFNVESLIELIKKNNLKISRATIYRYLDELVNEGCLKKIIHDPKVSACYQLCEMEDHNHFHLICKKCNKLIHLDCHKVDELIHHIEEEHDFQLDPSKVVLYGLCEECKNK